MTKAETVAPTLILRGTLRKKGKMFNNERDVTLSSEGIIKYYHFDKPGIVKGLIDLTSRQIQLIRFSYGGHVRGAAPNSRPPHVDDEFRIQLSNKSLFVFRASKICNGDAANPTVDKWEKAIRKFNKNVRV